MDGINQSAYILRPMNRLLLTFLALLAGLLAQGAPAQAREVAAGASQIGAVHMPLAQTRAAAQVQATSSPAARSEIPDERGRLGKALVLSPPVATVEIGIDRARE